MTRQLHIQKVSGGAKKALVYSFLPLGVLPAFSQFNQTPIASSTQHVLAGYAALQPTPTPQAAPVAVVATPEQATISLIASLTQNQPQAETLPFVETQTPALDQAAIVSEPVTQEITQQEEAREALQVALAKIRDEQKKAEEAAALAAKEGQDQAQDTGPNTGGVTSEPDAASASAPSPANAAFPVTTEHVTSSTLATTKSTETLENAAKPVFAFIWPVDGGISQPFTGYHSGIDIEGPAGTEIKAAEAGKVVAIASSAYGYGLHVIVDHGNGMQTLYAHLSKFTVEEGQEIKKGDVLGLRGSTGRSSGPHLHFETIKDGIKVNPIALLPAFTSASIPQGSSTR